MKPRPLPITTKTFRPYGRVIEYPDKNKKGPVRNLWRIVHRAPNRNGWRAAYLVLRDRSIGRLECHPASDETFEPVSGTALIFVSLTKDLNRMECFTLDRPVVVFKGIWHGLVTVSPETEIKITENLNITCRYWPFGFRLKNLTDLNQRRTV
ncbi:MAG: hypothetical protein AB7S78_02810 [Candidatus Omnitrophota bacterium]